MVENGVLCVAAGLGVVGTTGYAEHATGLRGVPRCSRGVPAEHPAHTQEHTEQTVVCDTTTE
jgi:hypothetical protein